ncbi:hypothetical protein CEUSTIGMA_g324.t1 [Chlamydomonas eustigma]|uniref:Methyltransferase n=1 Tax=Chlamydomonas eustigma TaxID=1157962 RepID=A0A250WQA3_9CHLO|nr:hypothetical protein CEUSTIGMA_g324.t1 [Chlamydomonas eustigma]|eukprot:GAX72869.1 hypothetical protein CEUSTIGMA_g324.t1 [Chlamydomonas eustigma]
MIIRTPGGFLCGATLGLIFLAPALYYALFSHPNFPWLPLTSTPEIKQSSFKNIVFEDFSLSPMRRTARNCLKETFYTGKQMDASVFSQVGEDGIIDAAFSCINTTNKYFVELGVSDGSQCTTRWLRESKGWSGLMLDGSHSNLSINLQPEFMTSKNIDTLLNKHRVPMHFDHMTVDIDLNTFWVLHAVLAAGFRPRFVAAEINRNFPSERQAFVTLNLPEGTWDALDMIGGHRATGGTCYFGASPLAMARMMQHFGYWPLVFDKYAINLFFVHASVVGIKLNPLNQKLVEGSSTSREAFDTLDQDFSIRSAATALPADRELGWPIHEPCPHNLWLEVPRNLDFMGSGWERRLRPTILSEVLGPNHIRVFKPLACPGMPLFHGT